jgi:hypothetical protein
MQFRIIVASAVAATIVSSAVADITYVSANRRVEAWAVGLLECDVEWIFEDDHGAVSSTEFGSFIESITALAGLQDWGMGSASQSTNLLANSFGGSGAATWDRDGGCALSSGQGESWFEVTMEIDQSMLFTLVGHMDGMGVYSFTGPGLEIEDVDFGPKNADFDESGVLEAGMYTFIISARDDGVEESAIGADFTLDVQFTDLCPADITGPDALPDGRVDSLDFKALLAEWGSPCAGSCASDITGPTPLAPDGNVDALDFLLLISQWGEPGNCP